jgi:hypothetical protein
MQDSVEVRLANVKAAFTFMKYTADGPRGCESVAVIMSEEEAFVCPFPDKCFPRAMKEHICPSFSTMRKIQMSHPII